MIDQILDYNKNFVARKGYEKYLTDKYPDKKLAVLSCMDTRLTELLPAALGLKNGDAKIIKNAGGIGRSKMKYIIFPFVFIALLLCSCNNSKTNQGQGSDMQTEMQDSLSANPSVSKITAEMAYEGVNNYCHKEYDWSVAKDNPDIMYIQMGEETEAEYEVVFRSYTGAFVYFYVDKTSGTTKMVEKVPNLGVEEESGTINLFDYLDKN